MSDLREQLARVGRESVLAGLVVGSGGNLSAREPGSDEFWVTAAGTWLHRLDDSSFARVRIADGIARPASAVVEARPASAKVEARPASAVVDGVAKGDSGPTTELALHLATYRVRADVNAIVHLHPQTAVLLDALGERIRLVTTDHAYYLGRIVRTPFHPPGSMELATAAAAAVADGANCCILAHHGCSVLGETVEMAHRRAANLEEAARLTVRALALTGALAGRAIEECPPVDFRTV